MRYSKKMSSLLSNKNYLIVMSSLGFMLGLCNALISKLEQMLCSDGYTSEVCVALLA